MRKRSKLFMKLLMVTADLPRPAWGASARNYYLFEALARKHSVSLLTLVDCDDISSQSDVSRLNNLTPIVQLIPRPRSQFKRWQQLMSIVSGQPYLLNAFIVPEMQDALDVLLAHDNYDVVLFESVLLAGYRIPAGIRVIIDQHNIEYEVFERTFEQVQSPIRKWYNWQQGKVLKQGEIQRCKHADAILVTSERERNIWKG